MSEVHIDDADPSVYYSGGWSPPNCGQGGHRGIIAPRTSHYSVSSTSKATVIFTLSFCYASLDMSRILTYFLTCISIRVYGMYIGSIGVSTNTWYTIDGGNAPQPANMYPSHTLLSSAILPDGQHNLTINGSTFYFVTSPNRVHRVC